MRRWSLSSSLGDVLGPVNEAFGSRVYLEEVEGAVSGLLVVAETAELKPVELTLGRVEMRKEVCRDDEEAVMASLAVSTGSFVPAHSEVVPSQTVKA